MDTEDSAVNGLWELLLENGKDMLPGVENGGRVGVLPKRQLAESSGKMIVWEKTTSGVTASECTFDGFQGADVDLLVVAEEKCLLNLWSDPRKDPIRKLREGIRMGEAMVYFLRAKEDLLDKGYEDLTELLGLPRQGCI